jgi:hypothetical protein
MKVRKSKYKVIKKERKKERKKKRKKEKEKKKERKILGIDLVIKIVD